MDLDNAANLAEIIGTALVIVSLVYVGVQIHQNTKAIRLSSAQNVSHDLRNALSFIAGETDFARIHLQGMEDVNALPPAEKHRFYVFVNYFLRAVENAYYQNKLGVLDEYVWESVIANIGLAARTSGYSSFWEDRHQFFSKEFQEFYGDMATPGPSVAVTPYKQDGQ